MLMYFISVNLFTKYQSIVLEIMLMYSFYSIKMIKL